MKPGLANVIALVSVVAVGFPAAVFVFVAGLMHDDPVGAVLGLATAAAFGYLGLKAGEGGGR